MGSHVAASPAVIRLVSRYWLSGLVRSQAVEQGPVSCTKQCVVVPCEVLDFIQDALDLLQDERHDIITSSHPAIVAPATHRAMPDVIAARSARSGRLQAVGSSPSVRGWKVALLSVGLLLWMLAGLLGVAVVAYQRSDVGAHDLSCPIPRDDSNYGPSHWQWWPPGRVCEEPTSAQRAPGFGEGAAAVIYVAGLVGLSIGTLFGFRSYIRVRLTDTEPVG
jgi:hypothetical protein